MTPPESILEAQTEALLRRVAREQESRCRKAQDAAAEQARNIVLRARQEARERLRQAIEEERRDVERAVANRRAAIETDVRRAEQAVLRQLIGRARSRLPEALERRWQDERSRQEWCRAACSFARHSLLDGAGIVVEVDASRSHGAEIEAAALLAANGASVAIVPVPDLGPGLRVRAGQACVDATVPGLLASPDWVDAELLAELERRLASHGSGVGAT